MLHEGCKHRRSASARDWVKRKAPRWSKSEKPRVGLIVRSPNVYDKKMVCTSAARHMHIVE